MDPARSLGPNSVLISKEAYYKAQAKKIMENHQTTIENVQTQNTAEQIETAVDSTAVAAANAAAAASAGLGGDVKFTDASPFEPTAEENFKPLDFLVEALAAGGVDPEFAERVKLGVPPEASDASIPVGERIFMVNRSLRLCISETNLPDTIQVRMLISDKLSMDNWKQIITHGLVPALNGKLPMKKG